MDRMTAETTRRSSTTRRRIAFRASAGMAACALTGSLGVAGAHASASAASEGIGQEKYLEMLEELVDLVTGEEDEDEDESAGASEYDLDAPLSAQELEGSVLEESELPGGWEYSGAPEVIFDETMSGGSFYKDFSFDGLEADPACLDAMEAIDELEEDAEAAVTYEAQDGEAQAGSILVSTPEEHDFFSGYYRDVVEECGTIRFDGAEVEFQPTEHGQGVQVRMQVQGEESWFYMAGQSYGNNHVLVIADSGEEIEDFEQILSDQLEKLEAELS